MATLKVDPSAMTLEGFFLMDYERMRERIKELEQEVSRLTPDGYGCIDRHQTCDAVKVDVAATYEIKYMVQHGMTLDQLRKAHGMTNDELLKWASAGYKTSTYGSTTRPIAIDYHKYQYTLTFRETRSTHTYVTDGESDSKLVDIDYMEENMADNLNHWCREEHLDQLKLAALAELRSNLESVISTLEEQQ